MFSLVFTTGDLLLGIRVYAAAIQNAATFSEGCVPLWGGGVCVTTRKALDKWFLRGQMGTVTQILEVVMDLKLASSNWIKGSQKGSRGVWGR